MSTTAQRHLRPFPIFHLFCTYDFALLACHCNHPFMGSYGAINSVKVMWPRTPEEVARKRNCAFVSFVHRSDAEEAKASVNDQVLQGYVMQIQWGKAVPIGKTPLTASMLAAHTHTQTPYAQAPGVSMMTFAPPYVALEVSEHICINMSSASTCAFIFR